MKNIEFLKADEVVLRPVELDDAKFLREARTHPEVRDYMAGEPLPLNMENQREFIESIGADDINLLIEHSGEKAGTIFLNSINKTYQRCEFGIFLHPEFHGKGIGSKALELFLTYLFDELNMHRVQGGYLEGNEASRRIMEKTGFQEEGRSRDYKYIKGEWKDEIWMSLLRDEWNE